MIIFSLHKQFEQENKQDSQFNKINSLVLFSVESNAHFRNQEQWKSSVVLISFEPIGLLKVDFSAHWK